MTDKKVYTDEQIANIAEKFEHLQEMCCPITSTAILPLTLGTDLPAIIRQLQSQLEEAEKKDTTVYKLIDMLRNRLCKCHTSHIRPCGNCSLVGKTLKEIGYE